MTTPTPSEPSSHANERRLLGMGLRLIAALCLAVMSATIKLNNDHGVSLIESLFYRQLFALPVMILVLIAGPGLSSVRTQHIGIHISRTVIGTLGMVTMFGAIRLLPLTEATTLNFAAPIFATILATLFLGERPGVQRWGAVLLGFAGVVLLVYPQNGFTLPLAGAALALCGAMIIAVLSILIRRMSRTEAPITIAFWFTLLSLVPFGVAMTGFAAPHDPTTWVLLVLTGLTGGIGQICLTSALRWAPVSVVLPMDYSNIIWATLFGWLLWDHWPEGSTWAGAALIITSGLFIAWREHVRGRVIAQDATTPVT